MNDAPWTLLTRDAPAASMHRASCVHPALQTAQLAVHRQGYDSDSCVELWAWRDGHWVRTLARLLPGRPDAPAGFTVLLFTDARSGSVRVGLVDPDGVLRVVAPERPDDERRFVHPALPAFSSHAWAWEDPEGMGVWILASDNNASTLLRLTDDAIVEVSDGPYIVSAALDPSRREIIARTVRGETSRVALPGGEWSPVDVSFAGIDAMAWDPLRGALIALRTESDARMDLVALGADGWAPVDPAVWTPTYRNAVTLAVDPVTRVTLAHGGQDFDRGGDLTGETLFGREGEMGDTHDPALPRAWGRANTLLCSEIGLLSLDHGTLRVHLREGGGWRALGRVVLDGAGYVNDLMVNAAWGDGALWVLDHEGRVVRWRPERDVSEVVAGPAKDPGAMYAHRVAMGWDGRAKALALFKGERARAAYRLRDGQWGADALADAPVTGIAAGLGTREGLYVLTRSALHLLRDDAWVKVGPALPTACYVLREDPTREALLAATHEGVFALAEGAWRRVATLPPEARLRTMGSGDAELAVDPRRDELVLLNGHAQWALPLSSLDLRGCALPTAAFKKKPAKKASA
jgi:hypothetical protein